jgi:hypothetical protein
MTKRLREPFAADHCTLCRCDCGCGTLKLVLHDQADKVISWAGFKPEDWLDLVQTISAECNAMIRSGGPLQ